MTVPVVVSVAVVLAGLGNRIVLTAACYVWAAFAHLTCLSSISLGWRELLPRPVSALRWLAGFASGIGMFFVVYWGTVHQWTIDWHGIRYHIGKGGRVKRMEQL